MNRRHFLTIAALSPLAVKLDATPPAAPKIAWLTSPGYDCSLDSLKTLCNSVVFPLATPIQAEPSNLQKVSFHLDCTDRLFCPLETESLLETAAHLHNYMLFPTAFIIVDNGNGHKVTPVLTRRVTARLNGPWLAVDDDRKVRPSSGDFSFEFVIDRQAKPYMPV